MEQKNWTFRCNVGEKKTVVAVVASVFFSSKKQLWFETLAQLFQDTETSGFELCAHAIITRQSNGFIE